MTGEGWVHGIEKYLLESRLSASGMGDNAVKLGAVRSSPGIYLTTEENSGKPQLGESLMKAVRQVIASNEVSYLRMRSVG
jgi:hypothetical protein